MSSHPVPARRNTAFISYSHAADGKLAPALQRALHNFAKPWYQLRALRIFRDKTSLAANPALWPAIESALGDSLWFLYMASPQAAQSHWVQKEVRWWLDHNISATMLIVLTDGELKWDDTAQDFDWSTTTSVPETLRGEFQDEPLYVDLRWARNEENLSLRHSQFRGVILDIAAALHGRPKEDLDGDDVRQHRRNKVWAWSAGTALAFLFVLASILGLFAVQQRNEAVRQRDEAVGRLYAQQIARAVDQADSDPGGALEVLDETARSAGELREFTWDLFGRLADRTLLALGGAWNHHSTTNDDAAPVLALSHDGSRLAAALQRPANRRSATISEVQLWDTKTGALLATLPLAAGRDLGDKRIGAIVFSPDDRELAASAGATVTVWDISTGRAVLTDESGRNVRYLLFVDNRAQGSDNRRLIAFEGEGTGREWQRVGPGATKRTFAGSYVQALSLSYDGRSILTAGPRTIERWNPATGARFSTPNPAGALSLVALSADGQRVAQANGNSIRVWRSGRDAVEWSLERGHRERIDALAFASDGRVLASGGSDGTVRLWDLDRGTATLTLRGPQGAVNTLEFSRDGRMLAAGSADASIFLWDVSGPPVRPAQRIETATRNSPACLGFSPHSSILVLGHQARLTARIAGADSQPGEIAIDSIRACGVSRAGTVAFAVDQALHVVLVDAATGNVRARTSAITDAATVRLTANGTAVAAHAGPGTFGIWDTKTGRNTATITVDDTLEAPFALLNDSLVIAQFRNSRGSWVGAWNVRSARPISVATAPRWDQYRQQFGVCPARPLFASTNGNHLQIADLADGRLMRRLDWNINRDVFNLNFATIVAFSPDCSIVAVGDGAGQITVWDVASGTPRYSVAAHSGMQTQGMTSVFNADGVNAIEFSPDGRTLVSGGGTSAGQGELKLWDAARGSLLATLPAESGPVKSLLFSETGLQLGVLLQRRRETVGDALTVLEVWSAQGPEHALLRADSGPISRLSFSSDGTELISAGPVSSKSWSLASTRLLKSRSLARPDSSQAASIPTVRSADGSLVVNVLQDVLLNVTQGATGRRLNYDDAQDYFPTQPIRALRLMADGTLLSLAGYAHDQPAEITRWDLTAGRPIRKAFEGAGVATNPVFSPDERSFVTVGAIGNRRGLPGFVHIWDAQSLQLIAALPGQRAPVTAAAYSSDGKRLATGDANGFVRIWDFTRLR